jgi:hypothetical protein
MLQASRITRAQARRERGPFQLDLCVLVHGFLVYGSISRTRNKDCIMFSLTNNVAMADTALSGSLQVKASKFPNMFPKKKNCSQTGAQLPAKN